MTTDALSPRDLLRQAIIEVASLPERDLLQMLAYIEVLKERRPNRANQPVIAAIRAEADRLAAGMKDAPRSEVMAHFRAALQAIRTQAIEQGTAIDGEWERD
jgi:hypothetical protein